MVTSYKDPTPRNAIQTKKEIVALKEKITQLRRQIKELESYL